jgi:4-amino-4-deoxy-L-arabinose transferase-like glycosyltransferase
VTTAPQPDATNAPQGGVYYLPISLAALLLRTAAVFSMWRGSSPSWFFNQASELGCLAQSIVSGHGLASPFGGATGPSAFLAPGYPLLVALAFRLGGSHSAKAAALILALQILFGVLTVLALMSVARTLLGARAANIAGALCAANPLLVCLPGMFWETSFSALCLVTVIGLALRCVDRQASWNWISLGTACAVAMLVNPALMLPFAGVIAWAACASRTKMRRSVLLTAVAWMLVFAVWPLRNTIVLHRFIPLRSNLGYELWQGNRAGSDGSFDAALHPNKNIKEFNQYATMGETAYMQDKYALAKTAIKADPPRFIRLSFLRMARFWLGLGKEKSIFIVSSVATSSFFAVLGLGLLFRQRRAIALLLALPLLFFPVPYYFTHADFRFRLVLEPIALLLAAYSIQRLCELLTLRIEHGSPQA